MARYQCIHSERDGFETIVLRDSLTKTEAEIVPSIGNNLFRFEQNGQPWILSPPHLDHLKKEEYAVFKYGTPILFPPNRIKNGSFSFKGRQYQLPINEPPHHLHGELCSRAWTVTSWGEGVESGAFLTAEFRYQDHLDILDYFPHPLVFTLTYRLREGQLALEGKICNEGNDEAPFAFGLHPYFLLPSEEMELIVPAIEEWPVTKEAFVTGSPERTELSERLNQGIPMKEFPPGECWLVTLKQNGIPCQLVNKDVQQKLMYEVDEKLRYFILFRPDWASAFSLEPYSYVTDAFNLEYAPNLTGSRGLVPREEFAFSTKLWIENV